MAFVYHAFFHVLDENGEKKLVSETEWGNRRLTGDDLTRFQADMEEAFAPFLADMNAGRIVVTDIVESIATPSGQNLEVVIGDRLTFPGATSKYQFHQKFYEWATVMKQDPNLTYTEPAWIDETP